MLRKSVVMALLCAALIFGAGVPGMKAQAAENNPTKCLSLSAATLKQELRELWIDHVVWTRLYIVSTLAGVGDQEQVLARLLRNQKDIGDAFKPYYGEAAGTKLTELLTEHIVLAGKLLDALKSGKSEEAAAYNKQWYQNADDIAKFLSAANPNWSYKEMKDDLDTHLKLLTEDISARMNKDWNASVAAFDKGENHMAMFGDKLVAGVVKQFPAKFK
ncbi:glycosyltransferase [Paenibacillus sp. YIM B09110]|uniref:glycosyltransferase n=1 Tax=Paenibacillus sp. YIM B09110 TaxID=3126102 RepID=UPI00301CE7DE